MSEEKKLNEKELNEEELDKIAGGLNNQSKLTEEHKMILLQIVALLPKVMTARTDADAEAINNEARLIINKFGNVCPICNKEFNITESDVGKQLNCILQHLVNCKG